MALALAAMVVVVRYKCRGEGRCLGDNDALDEAEQDALLIQHHSQLADQTAARAQAAQVDSA